MEGNYKALLMIRNDINDQCSKHPAYRLFNQSKITHFFAKNQVRLRRAVEKLKELEKLYVLHDENGAIKTADETGHIAKPEFRNEEDKKKYHEEYEKFMNTSFKIEI